ncbi:hypothetical protein LTR04_001188 [Oleoguttula sp. CCFEE 6159]|nr:hypothetical protein LTR04_001188 [Oleoguttula sp. CCFEE 6159]
MDAKPQRPLRALRVRDENMAPSTTYGGKTIHQRNKSTPALSTLMQVGVLKAATKRTAFADVSNTVRTVQAAKDDTAVSGKTALEKVSVVQVQEITKPAALSRPAQRPLSVAGIKAVLNNAATSTITSVVNREPIPQSISQPVNTRNVLSKRSTAVLKDAQSILKEPGSVEEQQVVLEGAPVTASVAPLSHNLPSTRQRSQTDVEHHVTARDTVKASDVPIPESVSKDIVFTVEGRLTLQSQQAYSSKLVVPSFENTHEVLEQTNTHEDFPVTTQAEMKYLETLEQQARAIEHDRSVELANQAHALSGQATEEYYEEDDDDEYYYEDAYNTTVRSLRFRGDNTTGGATMVLAPKVTARVERELAAAKQLVESSKTPEDIEDETWDTSMVAEYGDEIFQYMRTLEERMRPNPHYMSNQAEIQWSMRSVLMDWLVQVHHRFTLLPETLFLSVNYIDRFLSCKVVSLGKLQLVGATAIFVAAKYEEINCPSVQEIVYMVDNGYTVDEILKAERFMLSMLQFELGWPGPMSFLRRISKADDYDLETRTLAKYFLEITIMDERFVGCAPSFTAAGAHCLARLMLRKGDWTPAHVYYSEYTYSQLRQLLSVILECCEDPQKHHSAVFDKYSDKRYKKASIFVETEIKKGFRLPSTPRESTTGYREPSQSWRRK